MKDVMKSMSIGFAIGLFLLFCWVPRAHAEAVWSIDLTNKFSSSAPFSLVGTFTTADANVSHGQGEAVLSFSGTINGVQTSLVPLGTDPAFFYDNRFFGPTDNAAGWATQDAFSDAGWVFTVPGDTFNVYSASDLIGLYASGADLTLDGTIAFEHFTTSVPEVPIWLMLCIGIWAVAICARRKL